MTDLLQSLVLPNGSQESFHSSCSQPQPQEPPPASPSPVSNSLNANFPTSTKTIHAAALQAAGLPIYDVESYLNDPGNQALLQLARQKPAAGPSTKNNQKVTGGLADGTEPVQLGGPKTTYYTGALNQLCQKKGLNPLFEIESLDSVQSFGGRLKVNEEVVAEGFEMRWPSKKEAKEELAKIGLERIKQMETHATAQEDKTENWIGRLLEYHNATSPTSGAIYTEYALGSSFACTCTIPARSSSPFGSPTTPFPSKKAARTNAAKEAMLWLQSQNSHADGSNPMLAVPRKKVKLGTAIKVGGPTGEVKDATWGQKVNDLYPNLGLPPPSYRLAATSPCAPNLLSGAAYFNTPLVPGPVGEIKHVFGKKNAKEECAKGVFEFLTQLARERGGGGEDR